MDWRKVFAKYYLTKDMYLQHIKNAYKAVKIQPNLKNKKSFELTLHQRWCIDDKYMRRCLLSSEK